MVVVKGYGFECRSVFSTEGSFGCKKCECAQLGKRIRREFLCVIGVHRKLLEEGLELHKIIPARKPCVTDVLCLVARIIRS